jgi:flagellar biogenesis protein FliO
MNEALLSVAGMLLAGAALWGLWLRRTARGAPGDAIRIVTTRHLGAKQLVTLIEVDGERLLLGVAGDRVSLVARLGEPRSTARTEPDGAGPAGP